MTYSRTAPSTQDDIEQEARAWLGLLFAGTPSDADRAQFEAWLNLSPAHRDAFVRAEAAWSALGLSDQIMDWVSEPLTSTPLTSKSLTSKPLIGRPSTSKPGARQASRKMWLPIAGAAALAACVTLVVGPVLRETLMPVQSQRYVSGLGQSNRVTLDDGSVLTLDAASAVDVRYTKQARQIDLVRGNAYFDIARDEDRPLTVDAAGSEVLVLGTAFSVRLGPNDVTVVVSRGRVSIGEDRSDDVRRHVPFTTIGAGKRVVTDLHGRLLSETDADLGTALAWMEGQFVYDGATLADVVADLNRFRAKPLEISTPSIGAIKVTTSFRLAQQERFVASLPVAYPVVVRDLHDRTVIDARVQ